MNTKITWCLVNIVFTFLLACSISDQNQPSVDGPLFVLKNANETGVQFKNVIHENKEMNGLMYEFIYNGGGVAVGDLNQDGLEDLYFVSNLESNQLYLNQGDLKFREAGKLSHAQGRSGFHTGVTFVDINNDGKLDIYLCKSGAFTDKNRLKNELLINLGNDPSGVPRFRDEASNYGLDLPLFSMQSAFFDYDRDGDLDMFLINYGIKTYLSDSLESYSTAPSDFIGSRLYQNDNNKFKDVSDEAGIIHTKIGYGLGLAIGDLNGDHWPDVLVSNDFSEKDQVYINQKNGTFEESSQALMSHQSFFSMGNDIADINNDGWSDFFTLDMSASKNYEIKTSMSGMNPDRFFHHVDLGLHHQYMYNSLQLNQGHGSPQFSDVAQLAGVASTGWSWAPLFFDMDNDGDKDLFVSNGIKRNFRNNDFVIYYREKQEELKQIIAEKRKINIDSFVMHLVNSMPTGEKENILYQNNGDLTFTDMTTTWNLDLPSISNGAVYADLDNDGDLDIVTNDMDRKAMIYENKVSRTEKSHYLQIQFEGSDYNRLGIGAEIIVRYGDKVQLYTHQTSRGFLSSVSPKLHIGLGAAKEIDELKVIWPEGSIQIVKNVASDQLLILKYNDADLNEAPLTEEITHFQSDKIEKLPSLNHQENAYDDFKKESLMPHKMSQMGPALAIGDVNGDGLDDFYFGGAKGYAGKLYYQTNNGSFIEESAPFLKDQASEDVNAVFSDFDGDGDLDLYVVSGGNEEEVGSPLYQDRIYQNEDGKLTKVKNALPESFESGLAIAVHDFDDDGKIDLFVGSRQKPGFYPYSGKSCLLRNMSTTSEITFIDVTSQVSPELADIGMVTDALWEDLDQDGTKDLLISGEWTSIQYFKNYQGDSLVNRSTKAGLSDDTGWWFSIVAADFDEDGDLDLIGGNLGLNYKYQASKKEPFWVYAKDFDENKSLDIVLGYYNGGDLFPLRGRQCSSNQMPFIKKKFPTYDAFGAATIQEVYGDDNLASALQLKATNFATSYFDNNGDGTFTIKSLKNEIQISNVNDFMVQDFDQDGHLDLVMVGNWFPVEVETIRNDASVGWFLKGDGLGHFESIPSDQSGLHISGDSRKVLPITIHGEPYLMVAKNNGEVQYIQSAKEKENI